MNEPWNAGAGDDDLDDRLRDLDDHLAEMFAADLHDPDQVSVFRELVDWHARNERERASREASFRDVLVSGGLADVAGPPGTEIRRVPRARIVDHRAHYTIAIPGITLLTCVAVLALLGVWVLPDPTQPIGTFDMAGLEKPDLEISVMTTTDLGPFWLAVTNGYFRAAGFTFDPDKAVTVAPSGAESVRQLVAGEVDIAYATYPPFFLAQSRGEANLKLVADASSAGPNSCMVVALPGSKVRRIEDMAGARVAVTARNTASDLMTMSALKAHGVDYTTVDWVAVPFPEMAGKLASHEVDAAFMTEPYLSQARRTVGAVPVFDTATGPTANLPTAGFGASADFVRKYPKTVTAFQKVMDRATNDAKADRTKVEALLQRFAHVDPETAKLTTLLTFQSALDATRIQRVADLMLEFGVLSKPIEASDIIAKDTNRR